MVERNPRIPHSIESLLFVNRNGEYCGYKQELISDNIGADLREFLICAECMEISRKPRNWRGNTICEMCIPEENRNIGDIDKRVENKVAFLNSRCPLSGEGCSWEGKLREIEQHMEECPKVIVECQLKCGFSFEREGIGQHSEVCPLRIKKCDYCNQEVRANEENRHKEKCQYNPDTEVPCPYKELGCEAIVLRKNRAIHITENMTSHNKLMQYQIKQLNQLRTKNQQLDRLNQQQKNRNQELDRVNVELSNEITTIERSTANKERAKFLELIEKNMAQGKRQMKKMIWVISALVAVGLVIIIAAIIGIGITVANQGHYHNIKANSKQITYNSQQTESNSDQTESNLQLIESLLFNASYIYKYIEARGKVLPGIEWIYDLNELGFIYGPSFYLEQCKLRLRADAQVTTYQEYERLTGYYLERLEGKYDYSIANCTVEFVYTTFGYLDGTQSENADSTYPNTNLKVGESKLISYKYWENSGGEVIVKFYFDTTGD